MTDQACLQYLQDPEEHGAHVETCVECRALALGLEPEVDGTARVAVDQLPLASWEGASHRSWPIVVGGALVVLAVAIALLAIGGGSAFAGEMTRLEMLRSFVRMAPGAVQSAPLAWQVAIGIGFVVVNTLLYLLLRRAPRGVDA